MRGADLFGLAGMLLFPCSELLITVFSVEWYCERPLRYFALEQVGLRALRSCRSPNLMWPCSFPQRDPTSFFFFENLPPWQRLVRGMWRGGGEWDKTNLNRHFDSTVLYSTVQYCTWIPFFDFFGNRLQSCMLVNLARQVVMISTSKSYLVWGWRKRVIGDSMAISIYTFLF